MTDIRDDIKRYFHQQCDMYPGEIYLDEQVEERGAENPLEEIHRLLEKCEKCPLHKTVNHKVPGNGDSDARLMLIGEAPGREEDKQGIPFVGRSGQLLDKILAAIDLTSEDVFISNIVKCRPPKNRNPHHDEIQNCIDYLEQEIEAVDPDIIVALGLVAAHTLLDSKDSLKNLRQSRHTYKNRILIPTYHPSALLQNPKFKAPAWEDFK
ncbi:MAG TPA: uracil-DNA glycosylase, partial [bacterium]|nr:uracil-DNA glycosylase [bacterium]